MQYVTCPSCFEEFPVPPVSEEEGNAEMDYDCEVCCRPMVLRYEDGVVHAVSLDDL